MSQAHWFRYRLTVPSTQTIDEADELIDRLMLAGERSQIVMSRAFGAGHLGHYCDLIFRANKTKAERIATQLDALLDARGTLERDDSI